MKKFIQQHKRLEEEKAKLEQELASVGRINPANPKDWEALPPSTGPEPDVLDAAEQLEEFEGNAAILQDLEIRYNEVIDALQRMEKKTYGLCAVCGAAIEEGRLTADPAANTCMAHIA